MAGTYGITITYTAVGEAVPPVQLKFNQISARAGHTCAIASDNNVYCWEHGQYGELGNGLDLENDNFEYSNIPVQVINPTK